jgi:hypothetical protein
MKRVQARVVTKIKKYIFCSILFSKHHTIYEIAWKNLSEADRPHMTIQYRAQKM